jgi:hypothetical protein
LKHVEIILVRGIGNVTMKLTVQLYSSNKTFLKIK